MNEGLKKDIQQLLEEYSLYDFVVAFKSELSTMRDELVENVLADVGSYLRKRMLSQIISDLGYIESDIKMYKVEINHYNEKLKGIQKFQEKIKK